MFLEGRLEMIKKATDFINPVLNVYENMKVILKDKHRGGFWSKILN